LSSASAARIDPGTEVGPYVVERRLAQGGMSVLFVARDAAGKRVVLKMVPPEVATTATRARLMREARALASVEHPGVVHIHGTGEHEGVPWIAVDYVRGTDLKQVLADRGALPAELALRYALQAAEALAAAHDAGVIHRDLKPSNLLLTAEGRIVVVDFGIAKRRDDANEDVLTSAREVIGTLAYLSPEQLEHGFADERSDVWGLGCVLYELTAGAPPFGKGGSQTTAAILRDEPSFPASVRPAVVQVVTACLRKSSFARIASARELAAMLRDAISSPDVEPPGVDARKSSASELPRPAGSSSSSPSVPPAGASSSPTSAGAALSRGRVKGTAVRAGLKLFTEAYGETGFERVLELASPELRALLQKGDPGFGIIASGWYETARIGELLELVERVASPADPELFLETVAEAIARDNVGGVYRSLFRLVASPPLLEANAQRVWRTYIDEGTLTVRLVGKRSFEGSVRGWTRHDSNVCRMLRPMLERLLRATGYEGMVVRRTQCVAHGEATQCTFVGQWAG
jgi:serine/threonine protein kinase